MLCNIILKKDSKKDIITINNMYDIFYYLKKLELISSIKTFNYSIIFKDIFNNHLIIECNDLLFFKNAINFLKSTAIIKFKTLNSNDKINFMNTYYGCNKINSFNVTTYKAIKEFIDLFFYTDNINYRNYIIFLNYKLH